MNDKKKTLKRKITKAYPYLRGREEIHWSDAIGVRTGKKGFLLSFAQFNPSEKSYYIIWETVIPPELAKGFSQTLSDSIKDFEKPSGSQKKK